MLLTILQFVFMIVQLLLTALVWVVIANAIMSWLIAFDVINLRNRFAYQVARFLEAVTGPMLRPFRRFIPPIGGVDITPIFLFAVISAADYVLMRMALPWLLGMTGTTLV